MKTLSFLPLLLLSPLFAAAQPAPVSDAAGTNINVVVLVLATIFAGIILFLIYLERRLARLEKRDRPS